MSIKLCNATGKDIRNGREVCGSLVTIRNPYVEGKLRCFILPSTAEPKQVEIGKDTDTISGFVMVDPKTVRNEILE
jgi:hypothetical protein